MPYIFVQDYEIDLIAMNKDLHHIYIESHRGEGGERNAIQLRQNERGLPLTLRENFTMGGDLSSNTEKRDITTLELEFQTIGRLSHAGVNVCVPLNRLTSELYTVKKLSPKVGEYVLKRMGSIGMEL